MSSSLVENDGDVVAEIRKHGRPMSANDLCQNPVYSETYSPEQLSECLWVLAVEGKLEPFQMSPNKCNDSFVAR